VLAKITAIQEDHKAVFVQLERPADFKMNDVVNITKAKKKRTPNQNRYYWAFLTWVIHPGGGQLCDQGHFSTDALHEDVKAWIEWKHPNDFKVSSKFSTASLDVETFTRFLKIIKTELFGEFFEIDCRGFDIEHSHYEQYSEFRSGDFKDYMNERYSENVPF
jgi:hypothetical protein